MIHTIELQFEVFRVEAPSRWWYCREPEQPVGPFATEAIAKEEAVAALRGGYEYYSNAAFLARQRHQRNEEGDIPDPRAGE